MPNTKKQLRAEAIRLYDAFTHTHLDRRRLMEEMVRLTGSAAAASALIASIAPSDAVAAIIAEDDRRLTTRTRTVDLATGRKLNLYEAEPRDRMRHPAVIVIHENRGLNAHIRDVARRVAVAGFAAYAPDFLTVSGGTPADENAARQAIGALDRAATVADAAALAAMLRRNHGRVGAIGFCWGGGMVNSLAVAAGADLDAAVPYYGPAPDPALAAGIKAPMLIQLAASDDRINAAYPAFEAALKAAGVEHVVHSYPGTFHAFNNDTSAERYNKPAADLAWERTLAFLGRHLKGA